VWHEGVYALVRTGRRAECTTRKARKEKRREVLRYMYRACNPQRPFLLSSKDNLIIWQSEETYKTIFSNRSEVERTARELVRRGVVLCALCGGLLKYHRSYPRHIQDAESKRENGWVAQAHCAGCNKYPALIPEFIMPYKHYEAKVIESVIAASEKGANVEYLGGCAAEVSTMRRWVRQFKRRGAQAVGWLLSILSDLYNRHVSSLMLQNRTLLKQLARLLREFPKAKKVSVIGRTNIILTTRNCGFL